MTEPVTIVVMAYSVRHELVRCFASIREHAGMPVRTILVDNGSTDDTLEWVAQAHPEVEVVALDENIGYAARDHGLRLSESRYTMFLDSDAALTPGALGRLVEALDDNPAWGLVGPRLVYDDGTLQRSCRRFPPLLLPLLRRPPLGRVFEHRPTVERHLMADFAHDRGRPVLYLLGACQLFRTSLARAAGPFDENVFIGWDDADWCFRIREAGGEIVFVPDATVIHTYRRQTRAAPVSRAALHQLNGFVYFQRKYWSRRRSLIRLSRTLDAAASS
jgi:N-acetylglucosaminyl-diphospho-decaprenol L-rhamnosyltransferase